MNARQLSAEVRTWPCRHVDTLDGPVHLYAYTAPSGGCVYTYQRPGCPESTYTYATPDDARVAASFWERSVRV